MRGRGGTCQTEQPETPDLDLAMETKEQLQQKLLELDQRHKEEEKLKKKIEEQMNN